MDAVKYVLLLYMLITECYWNGIRGSGNKQILDARHSELFLEEAYWDQTLQYEHLGEHFQDEDVADAFCAIVNAKRLASPSTACTFRNHLITPNAFSVQSSICICMSMKWWMIWLR